MNRESTPWTPPRAHARALAATLAALVSHAARAQDPDAAVDAAGEMDAVTKTFWEMLQFGWQVNLILGVLAFIALFYFFHLLIVTRARRVAPGGLVRRILDDLASGAYETAQARLEQYPCLFASAFAPGLALHNQPVERIHRAVEAAGRRAVGSLRQRAGNLANIGVLAPMLGLLGTVLGLMKAFNVMTAEVGHGYRTQLLSAAIGEAMVTTAVGLIVGIPAMGLYFYAMNRIARASDGLEEASEAAVGTLEEMKKE